MIQPDYANPSAIQILRGAPRANWRKCFECGSESLHMDNTGLWVLCQHCSSRDTRLMKKATELLQESGELLDTPTEKRRYLCERCGGTGQQEAGCWSGTAYDAPAGTCQTCDGEGYLGEIKSLSELLDTPYEKGVN